MFNSVKIKIPAILIVIVVFFAQTGSSQTWTRKSPSACPLARGGHCLAYDSESDRVVLFGGHYSRKTGDTSDTWEYDLNSDTWTQKSPVIQPQARRLQCMAYDSESDRIVLFGGYDTKTLFNDTWEYDLNSDTWIEKSPSTPPSIRFSHSMVYDSESDRIVLFGGATNTCLSDTWEYDLNSDTWTRKSPSASPTARGWHGTAYDSESDRIVLFGGYNRSNYLNDTWEYDLNSDTWTCKSPLTSPSERWSAGMGYSNQGDKLVLFGGAKDNICFDDTWEYDLNSDTWTQESPSASPSARNAYGLEYDSRSKRFVFFGGYEFDGTNYTYFNDTWEYVPSGTGIKAVKKGSMYHVPRIEVCPNPFSAITEISFNTSGKIGDIAIVNLNGQIVKDFTASDANRIIWNASEFHSGVYILKAKVDNEIVHKELILNR